MNFPRNSRGGALVGVLALVGGLILGAAALSGLRFMGVDPVAKYLPNEKPVEEPPPVDNLSTPKELELRRMLTDVKKSKDMLDKERQDVATQNRMLAQERATLDQMKQQIDAAEKSLIEQSAVQNETEQKNMKRLAKMWGQAEPSEIKPIVKALDPTFTARVLFLMPEKLSMPILLALSAEGPEGTQYAADVIQKLRVLRAQAAQAQAQAAQAPATSPVAPGTPK